MADTRYFDSKLFNPEAFGSYIDTIPQTNKNELIKSRVIVQNARIKELLSSQTGSFYGTIPIFGRIGGDALNYDGQTTITADSTETFEQSVIALGRAKAWTEKDFSTDITAGVDFMSEVAKQVAGYWDDVNTGILLSVLKGIFSMTSALDKDFVNKHTHNIANDATNYRINATTLNTAIQKACGDKRTKFSLVFMHSAVATNLENLNLLEYLKYTDANGIQRALPLATWNGKTVIVDDGMPWAEMYYDATAEDAGALKVTSAGSGSGEVKLEEVQAAYAGSKELTGGGTEYVVKDTQYVTYVFGEGAIQYADLGAKVPYEMSRDPKTNGGEDTLYSRERLCFAPYGLSFTKKSVATLSPTNAELENGANWKLVDNGKTSGRKVIDHREIAIAQIFSRG